MMRQIMDRFHAMEVFTRVVETNSFSKAAEALEVSPSSVTTTIRSLENLLGVQLLRRSTRQLSVTHDGETYYRHCRRILADLKRTEASISPAPDSLKGRLRVEIARTLGQQIVLPALKKFYERFPEIELLLGLAEKKIDLLEEGVDCVILAGSHESTHLATKCVGNLQLIVCASPLYIARHGEPATIDDLSRHHAVGFVRDRATQRHEWEFDVDAKRVSVQMNGRLSVDDWESYLMCGVQGHGLIQPFELLARPYLRSGRLREVLSHYKSPFVPVSVAYPDNRPASAPLHAFVSWIAELFNQPRTAFTLN
jgi:LysR family transcriptional regulator for bpeEF and oprC